jgi:hypothetical protein
MNPFVSRHRQQISAVLECFDRVILRGHLPLVAPGYFGTWLRSKRIALNVKNLPEGWWNFKEAAPWFATQLKTHAQALAAQAGRPYQHLPSHDERMEDKARQLAQRDGVRDGLVCVYSTMETCRTFRVRFTDQGPSAGPDLRVCLVLYYYFLDRDFGLMQRPRMAGPPVGAARPGLPAARQCLRVAGGCGAQPAVGAWLLAA